MVDAGFKVHRTLGPGLLESVYEACLGRELELRGIPFERQRPIPVHYEGLDLDQGFRIDLFVASSIVVELKAVDKIQPIHEAQILTYLKLSKVRLGLLINFNVRLFKEGVRRFVL